MKVKNLSIFRTSLYTPAPVPYFTLDPSANQKSSALGGDNFLN